MEEDPFDLIERRMARLEKKMEEMVEQVFQPSWDIGAESLEPLYDVEETDGEILVSVDLPRVERKEDLEVNCTGNLVEIRANLCHPVSFRRWGTVQREADFKCYRKLIPLPEEVDPEGAEAKFKDGMLTLRLPKKTKRHKIKVL